MREIHTSSTALSTLQCAQPGADPVVSSAVELAPKLSPRLSPGATAMSGICRRILSAGLLMLVVVSVSGCAQFNYKRFAYDILRQEDCRRNDVDSFCARSFVFEYDEYEQLRQEYMRDSSPGLWDFQQSTLPVSSTRKAPEDL